MAAMHPLADRISDLRASTLEGHAARARSLTVWAPDFAEPEGDFIKDKRIPPARAADAE